jgi:hypothetical protein
MRYGGLDVERQRVLDIEHAGLNGQHSLGDRMRRDPVLIERRVKILACRLQALAVVSEDVSQMPLLVVFHGQNCS